MSLGRSIDHWGTNPGDAIDAALKAIETALQDLLATDPAYWRTEQKKDLLERLEKLQAQQAALKLRVLASAGDIAEETGAKDASAWMRAELLVDKAVARSQIKLATSVAKYDLVAAGLAEGVVSQDKARVITKALDKIETNPVASAEDLVLAEKLLVDYATRLTAERAPHRRQADPGRDRPGPVRRRRSQSTAGRRRTRPAEDRAAGVGQPRRDRRVRRCPADLDRDAVQAAGRGLGPTPQAAVGRQGRARCRRGSGSWAKASPGCWRPSTRPRCPVTVVMRPPSTW